METCPISTMNLEQAKEMQFKLVEVIHQNFRGNEFLSGGDYGIVTDLGCPRYTRKVEQTIARFFDAEDAILVRGAGTGAIRAALYAIMHSGDSVILHEAPVFPTTETTIEYMGLHPLFIDLNQPEECWREKIGLAIAGLIQHSRQKPDDHYDLGQVIAQLKKRKPEFVILTDDNYMVMKVSKIGVQLGADLSTFSMFKLLGPEGVGCIVGRQSLTSKIRRMNYSGGSQVQGPEAMEALRALVYTPVTLAIQSEVVDCIVERLNQGEVKGVRGAFRANAQSVAALVELEQPIAKHVLQVTNEFGAAPYPVGAESRYEVTAMFYKISGTFLKSRPELADYVIRINPMRAGADTVVRVLRNSIEKALKGGGNHCF
jgi:hypothetical protein